MLCCIYVYMYICIYAYMHICMYVYQYQYHVTTIAYNLSVIIAFVPLYVTNIINSINIIIIIIINIINIVNNHVDSRGEANPSP